LVVSGEVFDDYSEYLVAEGLRLNGFSIEGRKVGLGPRPAPDLDFVARNSRTNVRIGISVKNRLDYPSMGSVQSLLSLCKKLDVKPLLLARRYPPGLEKMITREGGRARSTREWILRPEFPSSLAHAIISNLGFPLGIYKEPPPFLIRRLSEVTESPWINVNG